MDEPIPDHRSAIVARSGDTHVIGADGKRRNVDRSPAKKQATEPASASRPGKTATATTSA